jgi:hypothetical protein
LTSSNARFDPYGVADLSMATKRLINNTIEDFYLWGLLTRAGGHRICWELNRTTGILLTRQEDVVLEKRPQSEDAFFNLYYFDDEANGIHIELIRNKCNGEFYSRELKNFDFLLMVKGELDFFEFVPFAAALKQLSCVQSVMEIEVNKLKNQEILILE